MKDQEKTQEQLIDELNEMRRKVAELEAAEATTLDAENLPVGYQSLDKNGYLLAVNQAWLDSLGYSRGEAIGKWFGDFLAIGYQDYFKINFPRFTAVGEIHGLELEMVKKDGSITPVAFDGKVGRDQRGRLKQTHCTLCDITDRKQLERALRESEKRYRTVADFTYNWEYWVDPKGNFLYVSPSCERITGYSAQEFIGDPDLMNRIIHPDDRSKMLDHYHNVRKVSPHSVDAQDFRIIRRDGATRWIGHVCQSVYDQEGQLSGRRGSNRDITEGKQAEAALKLSEDRYYHISSITSDIAYSCKSTDTAYSIDWMTGATERIFGYSVDDIKALKCWRNLVVDEDLPIFDSHVTGISPGTSASCKLRVRHKDGSVVLVSSFAQCVLESGSPDSLRLYGGLVNITERNRVEEALHESEERFRKLFEQSPIGIAIVGLDYRWIAINETLCEIVGYTKDELTKLAFVDIIHPDDIDEDVGYAEKLAQGEILSYKMKKRYIKRNGELVWINLTASLIRDNHGKELYYLFMFENITESKQMEEKLRQSEEQYRSLVEDSFDGIFIQKGAKIIFANSRLYEMLGYSPGELDGLDHWLIYHPDYHALIRQRATARLRGEKVISQYEVKLQKKDGAFFPADIGARFVRVDGEPGIQIWLRDISGRKKSEEVQKRLATAIEQSIESVMITDRDGNIQYVNSAFEHISGYRKEEVTGRDTRFLKCDRLDSSHYKEPLAAIRSGNPWKGRLMSQRKDGQTFYEDVTISPVRDSSGEIVNFVDVGHDVTENVELQMQLLQAQKMESLGTLAAGIAHDFNNLLQVVLGYSEFMLQRKKEGEPDYDGLQKIYQAGKRGADLVKSLMTFSRKVETKYVPVDLNQEITSVRNLLSRTISKTIRIDLHLGGNLESIRGDSSQICQVLMNLGVNARDAMPDGGTLTIETANTKCDEEYCHLHLEAKPGNYVLLTVSDTGQGMDEKTLAHIFEPFFTTKEKGKGTGLGLATVYGIVKQHGGHITCYSEPRHGTTFKIYFPSIRKESDTETPTTERPVRSGTETILLVDDENALRDLGTIFLNRFGYKVITANDGKEALDIYQREGDSISLIILDLIMPEMDGKQCLEAVLRVNPNAKVVLASGYSECRAASGAAAGGAKGFVQKPYDMRQLLTTIREILDED